MKTMSPKGSLANLWQALYEMHEVQVVLVFATSETDKENAVSEFRDRWRYIMKKGAAAAVPEFETTSGLEEDIDDGRYPETKLEEPLHPQTRAPSLDGVLAAGRRRRTRRDDDGQHPHSR